MSRARNLADLLQGGTVVPSAKVATLTTSHIPTLNATHMPNGSWILLHSVSSGVAVSEIPFNNTYITTAYDDYVMIGKSITPVTDGAEPHLRVSTVNGSSMDVYVDNGRHYNNISSASHGPEANRHTNGFSIQLATDLGNDSNQGWNFQAHFFGLNNTSFQKYMLYQSIGKHTNSKYKWDGGANLETTNPINYIDFKFSTGNIAAGARIALYGIKGSNH